MKKRIYSLVVVFTLILTSFTFAHSGRTDSHGGHRDKQNKSGLGSYHFHCSGNPPHLHKNGACPYNNPAPKAKPKTQSKAQPKAKVTSIPKQHVPVQKPINVVVNGASLTGAYAIQQNGRTVVSLRPICDALGVTLDWNASTQTAKGHKGANVFQLTVGNKTAKVNNTPVQLDVASQVSNGKTLVPVRFIAESLGATVDFNNSSDTVVITSNIK